MTSSNVSRVHQYLQAVASMGAPETSPLSSLPMWSSRNFQTGSRRRVESAASLMCTPRMNGAESPSVTTL
jgi:hypothetical protein